MSFFVKNLVQILLVFKPNAKMRLISLCAKFEGNPITCLHFYGNFFASVQKGEEKNSKKASDFLKTHISGMADMIYFRFSLDTPAPVQ